MEWSSLVRVSTEETDRARREVRGMASLQLCLPFSSTRRSQFRFSYGRVQCSSERQELFSRIAPVYDNVLNDLLSFGQHRIWKRMAVSWSGAKTGDNVLDVCCGSGDLLFLLSEQVGSQGKVIGLDFSKNQLSMASSRQDLVSKACYKNIEWVEGDALDLPFSDCFFDAITMGYGLRNVVDKRKALEESFRVLKPGSRISVLDFNKSTQPFTTAIQCSSDAGKDLEKLALEIGFSRAKHYELSGGLMGNLVATR
ncbi:2-phytyl-1,4-beta-naphthoquinone methyltransferase [Citrus sinensis]|uniref:2-phytyl-1,4-beta-naphthoquinone methyltransferase n=1 Tax=Citrus sinensis TaxID=2711 RepID=A0ACB8LIA3_CITSI|nr:2-phytyl-1,4-beta-naphthoquinone methyltransferase [Citrus sinensis]